MHSVRKEDPVAKRSEILQFEGESDEGDSRITGLIKGFVFVFGSNDAGIHGAGAARAASLYRQFPWGCGEGYAKRCYAIPTKDLEIRSHTLAIVRRNVGSFLMFANEILDLEAAYGADRNTVLYGHTQFQVTRIGCGLAGFTDEEIAPLFADAPLNCWFDKTWQPLLGDEHPYWGSFP